MSYYEKRIAELEARVAQLAREQRLKAIPVEAKLLERYALMQAENSRLKTEVERLRKAGDAMCELLRFDFVTKEWNDAKEGKQS
jgi:hypothetical protein